jgi:hypothetical protein
MGAEGITRGTRMILCPPFQPVAWEVPRNPILLSGWRTSFADVLFETDEVRFKSRIADALRAIEERLQSVGELGSIERISIESARRSLTVLEQGPFLVRKPRLEKTATANRSNGSNTDVKRTQHGIGSRVRFTLPSGEVIAAEIVVIFTASSGKNILVSFDKRFVRIGPEEILEDSGPAR